MDIDIERHPLYVKLFGKEPTFLIRKNHPIRISNLRQAGSKFYTLTERNIWVICNPMKVIKSHIEAQFGEPSHICDMKSDTDIQKYYGGEITKTDLMIAIHLDGFIGLKRIKKTFSRYLHQKFGIPFQNKLLTTHLEEYKPTDSVYQLLPLSITEEECKNLDLCLRSFFHSITEQYDDLCKAIIDIFIYPMNHSVIYLKNLGKEKTCTFLQIMQALFGQYFGFRSKYGYPDMLVVVSKTKPNKRYCRYGKPLDILYGDPPLVSQYTNVIQVKADFDLLTKNEVDKLAKFLIIDTRRFYMEMDCE